MSNVTSKHPKTGKNHHHDSEVVPRACPCTWSVITACALWSHHMRCVYIIFNHRSSAYLSNIVVSKELEKCIFNRAHNLAVPQRRGGICPLPGLILHFYFKKYPFSISPKPGTNTAYSSAKKDNNNILREKLNLQKPDCHEVIKEVMEKTIF